MCGIIGGINLPSSFSTKFITQGLYANAVRGWHSTGLVRVDDEVEYYKRALPAADFINSKVFDNLTRTQADAFIGHNRAATVGRIIDDTAHPFEHNSIIGVHNGTLNNHKYDLEDGHKFQVDSEALIYNIGKNGIKATAKAAEGAFAIVYYNFEDDTLNMVRNDARPLYIARLTSKNRTLPSYVYGSEQMLLEWMVNRNLQKVEAVWEVPVGMLYTFDMDTFSFSTEKIEVADDVSYMYNYGNGHRSYSRSNTVYPAGGKGAAVLDRAGVKTKDAVEFYLFNLEPYQTNKKMGNAHGCLSDSPFTDVIIYNIELATVSEGEQYQGKVSHGIPANSNNNERVAIDRDSLIMIVSEVDEHGQIQASVKEDIEGGPVQGVLLGPNHKFITRTEFDRLAKHGCGYCSRDLDYDREEFVTWNGDTPICAECTCDQPTSMMGDNKYLALVQ